MRSTYIVGSGLIVCLWVAGAGAGEVTVNGTVIPHASTTIEATQDIVESSPGGLAVQLIPGTKRYGVCVVAQRPIAALDADLPLAPSASRFTVVAEDGRAFANCLIASVNADGAGAKRRLSYCLRCEDVTTPAP